MPRLINQLTELESTDHQERLLLFKEIHESDQKEINVFLNLIIKASRKVVLEYLDFCVENSEQGGLNSLHNLICDPRCRFRENVLDCLVSLKSQLSPNILFNLFENSSIQFRKKILNTLTNWNITEANTVLFKILSRSEPELLALALDILGGCTDISNTDSIENLLKHPVPLVRKKAINAMLRLNKENWFASQVELLPSLDSYQQEDILQCCLEHKEVVQLNKILHSEIPDNWIHQLLKSWPKSADYLDQLTVLNLVSNRSQRSSLSALKWLSEQNVDHRLSAEICNILRAEKYQIFHNLLLKVLSCIPFTRCFQDWQNLSQNLKSLAFESHFRNQLRLHVNENSVEIYLKNLLNSLDATEVLRGLECLPSEKIDADLFENLNKHDNNEILNAVEKHLKKCRENNLEYTLNSASQKIEEGDLTQAHWMLEEVFGQASDNPRYLYLFAQTKRELKDLPASKKLLQKSLQINSSQQDVRKSLAKVELDSGNTRNALSLILECIEKNNHDASLKLWLFEAYGRIKELKLAYTSFFDVPKAILRKEHWELFIKCCFKLKKYRAVIEHFNTYIQEIDEDNLSYHTRTYLALSYHLTQNAEKFEKEINHLKCKYDNEISYLKAWKLLDHVTKNKSIRAFYLERRATLYSDSEIARKEWLEFSLKENPKAILTMVNLDKTNFGRKIKAKALRELNRFEESIEIFEKLYLEDSSDESLPWELGLNWFNAGRHSKALKYFQFYEHHHLPPQGFGYYLAICYLRINNYSQACTSLSYSLEERPFHEPSWILLLDLLERQRIPQSLQEYLIDVPSALNENSEALLRYIQHIQDKDSNLAEDLYQSILNKDNKNYYANLGLARMHLKLGKNSSSYHHFHKIRKELSEDWFELYSEAAERSLNYSEAFRLYLQLCKDEHQFKNLKSKIQKIIKGSDSFSAIHSKWRWQDFEPHLDVLSEFPLLHYKMGILRYKENNFDSSHKHLKALRAQYGSFRRSDYLLAKICLKQKNVNQARLHLEDALINEDIHSKQIHNLLAPIYIQRKDNELARKSLLKLYASQSHRIEALKSLYKLHDSENRLDQLLPLLQEGVAKTGSTELEKLLGISLYKLRKFPEANAALRNSKDEEACFFRCLTLNQMNDFAQAVHCFKALEKEAYHFEDFHYHYGIALVELNRFQAASNQFRCSIELEEQIWNSRCELVRLHLKCLNPNLALQDFKFAMHEKFDLELCYEMVRMCFQQEQHEVVLEIFQSNSDVLALEAEPDTFNKICQAFLLSTHSIADAQQSLEVLQIFYKKDSEGLRHFLCRKDIHDQIRVNFLVLSHKNFVDLSYPSFEIGSIAYMQENWDQSLEWYSEAEKRNELSSLSDSQLFEIAHNMSHIFYRKNDLKSCKIYVQKALAIQSENIEMLEKLSYLLMREDKTEEQSKIDQKLFFLKPDNAKVSERLIDWFENIGNLQNAIYHLKNYLKTFPSDFQRLKQLARISNQAGMNSLELSALRKLEDLGSKLDSDHHLKVGRASLSLGQQERAAMAFQKHLSKNPENSGLHFQLAKLYRQQGYLQKARLTLLEILQQDSGNPVICYELASIFFDEKNYERCLDTLEQLFRIKPFHVEGNELLARVHYQQGHNNLAMKALDQVLQNEPNHHDALLMQARLYRSEEIHEEASRLYERLFKLTQKEEYLLEMSLINIKMGRNTTAKKQLQKLSRETEVNGKLYKMARNILRQQA
tara:strand:+ start:1774 stop:6909 length:5136 start_codon:yes stop_codon:yes gene_type:complete